MLEALATITKGLGYAAALIGGGTLLARATLARSLAGSLALPVAFVRFSGCLLAMTSCATAAIFFLRLGGGADPATLDAIFFSPLGLALCLQLLGGIWLGLFGNRNIAIVGAFLIFVAFGVAGHSASRGPLTAITVVLHATAAGWWAGGLCILLRANHSVSSEFSQIVMRFGQQAIWVVIALLAAALTTAAALVEFRFDFALAYQQVLLTKLGLAAGLLTLAGINRLMLTPGLAGLVRTRVWLRRLIATELLLFAGVIGTTAYLTTYLSPHAEANHVNDSEVRPTGPISIIDPWAPAMPGGVGSGAGYMVIVNNQANADRLVGASSPWAENVTLHASINDGNITRMRDLPALAIPRGGRVTLKPGVYHLMFTGLYAPFVAGDEVPLTLVFANAGRLEVRLKVLPLGERPYEHRH